MKSIHDRTIERLQLSHPEFAQKGFMTAVRRLASERDMDQWDCMPIILPDLWHFDEACMSFICIEVEDAHRISAHKLAKFDELWWYLDSHYWELHLISSDRWGNLTPIPIHEYGFMGQIDENAPELGNSIKVERQKNREVFELTQAYCIKDEKMRRHARTEWMSRYPLLLLANFGRHYGPDVPEAAPLAP